MPDACRTVRFRASACRTRFRGTHATWAAAPISKRVFLIALNTRPEVTMAEPVFILAVIRPISEVVTRAGDISHMIETSARATRRSSRGGQDSTIHACNAFAELQRNQAPGAMVAQVVPEPALRCAMRSFRLARLVPQPWPKSKPAVTTAFWSVGSSRISQATCRQPIRTRRLVGHEAIDAASVACVFGRSTPIATGSTAVT